MSGRHRPDRNPGGSQKPLNLHTACTLHLPEAFEFQSGKFLNCCIGFDFAGLAGHIWRVARWSVVLSYTLSHRVMGILMAVTHETPAYQAI